MKKVLALIIAIAMLFCVVGCSKTETPYSSSDVEVIIEEEIIIDNDDTVSSDSADSSDITENNSSVNSSKNESVTSSKNESIISSKNESVSSKNDSVSSKNEGVISSKEEGTSSKNESTTSSKNDNSSSNTDKEDKPTSSKAPSTSSTVSSETSKPVVSEENKPEQDDMMNIDYEWKSHPEDYKLLAFTFDDGPTNRITEYVNLFAAFEGAGTFFVNGTKIKGNYEYTLMQNAIDYGWDIGNHGDNHLVATIGGGSGTPASYDQLRADIMNLTDKLESNLKFRDGSPYDVSLYRPPNIKPTANTFKICDELNYPVIWLKYDALDWDLTKTDKDRENVFKYGVGTWKDGDIILCHEVQQYADQTYAYIEKYLPEFYRKGYRFCSITELMELRGITREQICGELNSVDGNRGMVTNILDAAKAGKK